MGIELFACTMRPTATGLPQRIFTMGSDPIVFARTVR